MGEESNLIEFIEKKLDNILLPVNLENNYIDQLNSRLFKEPQISLERENYVKLVFLIVFAFLSGFTIVIIINRIFSYGKKK